MGFHTLRVAHEFQKDVDLEPFSIKMAEHVLSKNGGSSIQSVFIALLGRLVHL